MSSNILVLEYPACPVGRFYLNSNTGFDTIKLEKLRKLGKRRTFGDENPVFSGYQMVTFGVVSFLHGVKDYSVKRLVYKRFLGKKLLCME